MQARVRSRGVFLVLRENHRHIRDGNEPQALMDVDWQALNLFCPDFGLHVAGLDMADQGAHGYWLREQRAALARKERPKRLAEHRRGPVKAATSAVRCDQ